MAPADTVDADALPRWFEFEELFAFCDLHTSRWQLRTQARMNQLAMQAPASMFNDLLFPLYYDRQGFPIPSDGVNPPVLTWAKYREDAELDAVRVAADDLPDGSWLSTVWLGIDHAFGLGRPLIFETMRFARDSVTIRIGNIEHEGRASMEFPDPFGEPGETIDQLRYSTEEEARAAHHEIVRRIVLKEGH